MTCLNLLSDCCQRPLFAHVWFYFFGNQKSAPKFHEAWYDQTKHLKDDKRQLSDRSTERCQFAEPLN